MPSSQPAPGRWWQEASGAVADLGVLIPIAVALIVANGLSPTAVLLPAALLYLVVARVYRLPIAVQPLKAFGAVAIAAGAGADVIAAGSLLMGGIFLALGAGNWLSRLARMFPRPVVRGIQLSVGLLFAKVAWGLVTAPQPSFTGQVGQPWLLVTAAAVFCALVLKRRIVLLVILAAISVAVVGLVASGSSVPMGPAAISFPALSFDAFATAFAILVLPQLPLTVANSCIAPADAARAYFGPRADRVTPARLARTLGAAGVFAGLISGMPACHGAGGLSAHYAFGARTWRAPLIMGGALLVLAVAFGAALAETLPKFPLPVLAALLGIAGAVHAMLLRDLRGKAEWAIAIAVGVIGATIHLALAMALGLAAAWLASRWRPRGDYRSRNEPTVAARPSAPPARARKL